MIMLIMTCLCYAMSDLYEYENSLKIWDYECMYEVSCLMWYFALDRVMRFYTIHWTTISWVVYMLRLYYVGIAYDS